MQFTVAPVHAAIIMQFQEKSRYLKNCIIVCIICTLLTNLSNFAVGLQRHLLQNLAYLWILLTEE